MQINTVLFDSSVSLLENLFYYDNHFTIMSYNRNELIAPCQQGRVLMVVRGECVKLLTYSGLDESGLGYWNWI